MLINERAVSAMYDEKQLKRMKRMALEIRRKTLYQIAKSGAPGHIGGTMSICELMGCLYGGIMKIDPKNPKTDDRDRFIMSKGHAGPAMYSALAVNGFFPMEWLDTLNCAGTNLPSHTDMNKTPGVDMTTGSLGQGTSSGFGIAYGMRLKGLKDRYAYVLIGDGESQEGQIWEALQFAPQYKMDNLIAFLDRNGGQVDAKVEKIIPASRIEDKVKAFGWHVQTVENGHDVKAIAEAIEEAKKVKGVPSFIVLNTIKGYGCPMTKNAVNDHSFGITMEEYEECSRLIDEQIAKEDLGEL